MNQFITVLLLLVALTSLPAADEIGPTSAGAIQLRQNQQLLVRTILPVDSRVVRGFTHGPIDGREDTRYSEGSVGEWNGLSGTPAVNYRVFNGNNGLHLTLPEEGFDALQVRGDWRGNVYLNSDALIEPSIAPFCEIPLTKPLDERVSARRLSFFYAEGQTGALKQVGVFRVDQGSPEGEPQEIAASESATAPLELSGDWKDLGQGIGAAMLEFQITKAESDTVLTVRVGDVLDPRRQAMIVDLRVPGPGSYRVGLDFPDQVFLPPKSDRKLQPRMEVSPAPTSKIVVSIESGVPVEFQSAKLIAHAIPRDQALPEAIAWRSFLLRGLFSALSEPRPWMHLVDGKPIREQIETNPAIQRYKLAITEVLETAELARLLAPEDELIIQYHDWLYQNIDKRKPESAPVLPEIPGAPRWAVLIRENWIEQAHIARWWLENRMTPNGELGGGPQDDTDMYQVWQCLPMIESEPLGGELKVAGEKLAEIMLEHHLEDGINRRSMDALHAYEEGVNQLALNAWWNYGDPVHFERVMASARSAMKLMVETEDGRLHFGDDRKVGIAEARNGFEKVGASPGTWNWAPARLMLHPMHVVAEYNRNPAVLDRYTDWGRTWMNYQKPNAFVDKVEIKTGKPIRVTDLPASANIAPVEEFLSLYMLTGDPEWRSPYLMGVDGGGFTGVTAQYGRATHALVPWPEPYQKRLRDKMSEPGAGYAGFFLNQDRELLEPMLADSLSWFRRYRHMNTAAEQKTDRILTYKATAALSCYLGDAPNRNRWLNLSAVSYEDLRGEDFAALVWNADPRTLRVAFYNFTENELAGRMRVWRLEHGYYRLRIGADRDDNGLMDDAASQQLLELQRYSAVPLSLPPGEVTILEFEQQERLDPIFNRADLAISQSGETVTIHNIGSREARNVKVDLQRRGETIDTIEIDRLEAPLDLYPRSAVVEFQTPLQRRDVISVDPGQIIPEISEHNNSATFSLD